MKALSISLLLMGVYSSMTVASTPNPHWAFELHGQEKEKLEFEATPKDRKYPYQVVYKKNGKSQTYPVDPAYVAAFKTQALTLSWDLEKFKVSSRQCKDHITFKSTEGSVLTYCKDSPEAFYRVKNVMTSLRQMATSPL